MNTNYVRYGDEWSNEVAKNKKETIIHMLRSVAMERDELQAKLDMTFIPKGEWDICTTHNRAFVSQEGCLLCKIAQLESESIDLISHLEGARISMDDYLEYRNRNTLNFQLEKADSYLRVVAAALKAEKSKADELIDRGVCPSCTWRGDVELENGVCPQCDTNWLTLRDSAIRAVLKEMK